MRCALALGWRWLWCAALAGAVLAAALLAWAAWQAGQREVHEPADLAPRDGRWVAAGDVRLFVREAGPRDGQPVLLVHGTGAWSETWRRTARVLGDAGFRAISIDLPPFGFSQRPSNARYGKADQAARISALLAALEVERAILVGHSFGGGPTLEAAMLSPGKVHALVMVDAALGIRAQGEAFARPPAWLAALLGVEPLRDAVVAAFLTNPAFTRKLLEAFVADPSSATDDWVRVYRRPLTLRGTTQAVGKWLPALVAPAGAARSEDPAAYAKLKLPVVALWGDLDTITPLAQAQRLVRLVPRGELVVLNGVGHIPQIERPAQFDVALLGALRALAATP